MSQQGVFLEKGMIYTERKVWMLGAKQINGQELFDAYSYLLSSFALMEDASKFISKWWPTQIKGYIPQTSL